MLKKTTLLFLSVCLLLIISVTAHSADKKVISIATGGTAGTYYTIGAGLAQLVQKYMPGYKLVVQSTGASIENIHLVANKRVDIAIVMSDPAYFAYIGGREFKDKAKYPNLRAITAGHSSMLQGAALASSGIKSIADLRGKKVALGAPGSPSKYGAIAAMEAYGVNPGDYKAVYLTYSEMVQAIKDGTIDAGWFWAGVPTSSLLDLTSTAKVNILQIEADKFPAIAKKHPYYGQAIIPANTYSGQDKPVPTISCSGTLITHIDVPEETVYLLTKTILEHTKELGEIHKAGYQWNLDGATKGVAIPFHDGAKKFLKEKGAIK